jgi:hypothetical protein
LRDQSAVVHDNDPVAKALGAVQLVSGDQDCIAPGTPLQEQSFQLARALGIDPDHRLVEAEETRPVDERARAGELLSHPFGEGAGERVPFLPEIEALQQALGMLQLFLGAVGGSDEAQMLPNGEQLVRVRRLRHIRQAAFGCCRLVGQIVAAHGDAAGGRLEDRSDAAESRGLSGAIRPEEAHDLAAVNLIADVLNSREVSEVLGEAFDFQHAGCCESTAATTVWKPRNEAGGRRY